MSGRQRDRNRMAAVEASARERENAPIIAVAVVRVVLSKEDWPPDHAAQYVLGELVSGYAGLADFMADHDCTVRLTVHRGPDSKTQEWHP